MGIPDTVPIGIRTRSYHANGILDTQSMDISTGIVQRERVETDPVGNIMRTRRKLSSQLAEIGDGAAPTESSHGPTQKR